MGETEVKRRYNSYSVLMSVYKKENPEYFKEAVNSMMTQTIPPNDFVLVCDGPLTEELDKVVETIEREFSDILQVIRLEKNVGLGRALNIGLQKCKNELIARMDSDDISEKRRCEHQMRCFETQKELAVCSGSIAEFSQVISNVLGIRKLPCDNQELIRFAKTRNPINHMAVMYRKSDVLEAGNYQDLAMAEDYFLWVRMMMKGKVFKNLEEVLVYARVDNGMIKRRGGIKYIKSILTLQKQFRRLGFISQREYIKNCGIRCFVALVPSGIRSVFYKKKLRIQPKYRTDIKK